MRMLSRWLERRTIGVIVCWWRAYHDEIKISLRLNRYGWREPSIVWKCKRCQRTRLYDYELQRTNQDQTPTWL